jgi:hypothetical protein
MMTHWRWTSAHLQLDDRGAVELREVETFLVLAVELHFGRTAQRLRLS